MRHSINLHIHILDIVHCVPYGSYAHTEVKVMSHSLISFFMFDFSLGLGQQRSQYAARQHKASAINNRTHSNHSGRLHTSTMCKIRFTFAMSCRSRRYVAYLGMRRDAPCSVRIAHRHFKRSSPDIDKATFPQHSVERCARRSRIATCGATSFSCK
jgi:hypothetical protein